MSDKYRSMRRRRCLSSSGIPKHLFRSAEEAASKLTDVRVAEGVQAYECRRCGFWHIGKPRRKSA